MKLGKKNRNLQSHIVRAEPQEEAVAAKQEMGMFFFQAVPLSKDRDWSMF